jgi:hypothetical protein
MNKKNQVNMGAFSYKVDDTEILTTSYTLNQSLTKKLKNFHEE